MFFRNSQEVFPEVLPEVIPRPEVRTEERHSAPRDLGSRGVLDAVTTDEPTGRKGITARCRTAGGGVLPGYIPPGHPWQIYTFLPGNIPCSPGWSTLLTGSAGRVLNGPAAADAQ